MSRSPDNLTARPEAWPRVRFADDEYRGRLSLVQSEISARGIGAAVIADERTTWYLTGFGSASPIGSRARPRVLVVPQDGEPTFFVHESTAVTVREMCCFDDVRTYHALGGAPVEAIAARLRELGGEQVGLEIGGQLRSELTAGELIALRDVVGPTATSDVAPAVWAVRSIKSAAELDRIRLAGELTSRAYVEAFDRMHPGMTEQCAARIVREAIMEQGADGAWSIAVAGHGDYVRVDGVPRNRPVASGELVFIDCGANVGGYWADFSRAGVIGGPSDEQLHYQQQIVEATAAGVRAIRVGSTLGDVARASGAVMERHGLEFSSRAGRIGHGMGMLVTEPPDVAEDVEVPIAAGMVLTIEPGVIRDSGIFHAEQNVIAQADGPEVVSVSSSELTPIT